MAFFYLPRRPTGLYTDPSTHSHTDGSFTAPSAPSKVGFSVLLKGTWHMGGQGGIQTCILPIRGGPPYHYTKAATNFI